MQLFLVFITIIGYANAECLDYPNTTCQNIKSCDTLRELIHKTQKTFEDREKLRKRHCGFDGLNPKICCPNEIPKPGNECMAPDGVIGQCVDIRNCSYFVTMLQNNPVQQDTTFILKSRCDSDSSTKVCCPPTPPVEPIQPITPQSIDAFSEECKATALPPDAQSDCCGRFESYDKITGGSAAKIDEFPWLALLEYRKRESNKIDTKCGGALISGRYVLTAAHCLTNEIMNPLYTLISVRLGEYDTGNNGPDCVAVAGGGTDCNYGAASIPIERSIQHPGYSYSRNWWNDIALLRLSRITPFNYFIQPICLPSTNINTMQLADMYLRVAGWGATNENNTSTSIKQVVGLPYVNFTSCKEQLSRVSNSTRLWAGQVCAGGEPGKDSCTGDSGGPLIMVMNERYQMVGLVSYGAKPCGRLPGIYTNVFVYLDWIRSNIHE